MEDLESELEYEPLVLIDIQPIPRGYKFIFRRESEMFEALPSGVESDDLQQEVPQ